MCAKAKEDKAAKAAEKAAAKEAKAAKSKSKAKKKSNAGANEYNFFLLHGEKIGIAVAAALFLAMVAGGSGLEKFTLTPDQISQAAKRAEETIANSKVTPKEYDESLVRYDYNSYAELIKSAVKVNAYETPTRWEQSLFPDKNKRPNVVPEPLENLRAIACIGAIQYNAISASTGVGGNAGGMGGGMTGMGGMGGEMGGGMTGMGGMGTSGELKGRQWITVTGSIPIGKQQNEYGELFGNAQYMDDVRDQPRYIFYELERGVPDASGTIQWSKIDVLKAIKKENNQWAGVGSDQVGYNYMAPTPPSFPPMAMSCPPMGNKPFGEEIANLPNVPLNSTEQLEVQQSELEDWNKLQSAMKQMDESTLLDRDPFSDARTGGGMGMSGGIGGANGTATGNSWMINREAASASMLRAQTTAAVDYYLFRYFDFDVKEGETYVYRVKLLLANPNYGVEERFVEDPTTITKKYVESDFSQPSNPVALGLVSRVFAEDVEAPTRSGAEPRAKISSIYFDQDTATESIIQGQSVVRGQVANFYNQAHQAVSVAGARAMGAMDSSYGMTGGTGRSKKNQNKSVDHISDVCLVDVAGGSKISGVELRSPGKMMILEPNGLMEVREVKEDARELGRYDGSQNTMGGMGTGAAGTMM